MAEAKTVVFWDLEDYKIPNGLNPGVISENIKTSVASMGYKGPVVSVKAYCNKTNQIHEEEDGFLAAGMALEHVPEGRNGKDHSRDMWICKDMLYFALGDPEPSNLMVISDNLFSSTVNKFKSMNYNVVWKRLSAEGMPIDHESGRSSQRMDNACSGCGIKISNDDP